MDTINIMHHKLTLSMNSYEILLSIKMGLKIMVKSSPIHTVIRINLCKTDNAPLPGAFIWAWLRINRALSSTLLHKSSLQWSWHV